MAIRDDYQTAIVLQGGGALGAYEYGVLNALYDTRPGFQPAVVTGVSIGAITATVLVGAAEPDRGPERIVGNLFRGVWRIAASDAGMVGRVFA